MSYFRLLIPGQEPVHSAWRKSSEIRENKWGEKDSNLRSFRNGFTVRPIWPLWYLPFSESITTVCERTKPMEGFEPPTH
jgi:hypothetical protein